MTTLDQRKWRNLPRIDVAAGLEVTRERWSTTGGELAVVGDLNDVTLGIAVDTEGAVATTAEEMKKLRRGMCWFRWALSAFWWGPRGPRYVR
mmetsp:Transcript_31634/g.69313  ORF Transcript_31634/g.69313 Transcript_31634/m.69313 type:complete len:92 (-) Transcript_31634:449-724(-)